MITQILAWYAALLTLGLVGLPITLLLFESLPDYGYPFARAIGLLTIGYSAWLLTILGLARFGSSLLIVLVLILGIAGWMLLPKRALRLAALRARWRSILAFELLFLGAFLFLAWLRMYDPNPQGTERPMDYAFYNAIMCSQTFPPHDPWLSGYAINYYYLGYLLMGVPNLLSAVDPGVGFNLSLATLFALTAVHAAGLIYNLITLHAGPNARGRVAACLLGVAMLLILGNQSGALEILARTEKVVALDAQQAWIAVQNGISNNAPCSIFPIRHLPLRISE